MDTTEAIIQSKPPPKEPRRGEDEPGHHSAAKCHTVGEWLQEVVPETFVVAQAGPPVILIFGPWLLLVLLLIPPAAFLITLVLLTVIAAAALVALGALVASPYLLVRHLRARHSAEHGGFPFPRRRALAAGGAGAPQSAPSGWVLGPAATVPAPHAAFTARDGQQIQITQMKGTT
jgi:hypothetical protein